MNLYSIQYWIIFISDAFQWGFSFFCILCLLARWIVSGKKKEEVINIHSAVNLSLAISALLSIFALGYEYYEASQVTSPYEHFAFTDVEFSVYRLLFFILAGWLASLLFFVRGLRHNWILSLVVLLLLNAGTIEPWLMRVWRDYIPAGWETAETNNTPVALQIVYFAVFAFFLYLILAKRKKLPYPSAWIR